MGLCEFASEVSVYCVLAIVLFVVTRSVATNKLDLSRFMFGL